MEIWGVLLLTAVLQVRENEAVAPGTVRVKCERDFTGGEAEANQQKTKVVSNMQIIMLASRRGIR